MQMAMLNQQQDYYTKIEKDSMNIMSMKNLERVIDSNHESQAALRMMAAAAAA